MKAFVRLANFSLFIFILSLLSCVNSTSPITAQPMVMPDLGNTSFSTAALQTFLSGARERIAGKQYEPNSILGQLAQLLKSPDDKELSLFIKRLLRETRSPPHSLLFYQDFMALLKKEDPELREDFIIKNLLTTHTCGDHSDSERSKVHLEIPSLLLYKLEASTQEALNKFLARFEDSCGTEGCSKDCTTTVQAHWPRNLVLSESLDEKPAISESIVINKNSTYDNKDQKYHLIAVVATVDSEGAGPYYAYVKYGNNWFKSKDGAISLVNKSEIFSKKLSYSYLMYQKST